MSEISFNGRTVLYDYPDYYFIARGGKHVYVANQHLANIFQFFADYYHDNIEPIAQSVPQNRERPRERYSTYWIDGKKYYGDLIGIHAYRSPNTKVGTGNRSNHRSASAIDINGHKHPYEATMAGTWYSGYSSTQKSKIRTLIGRVTDNSGRKILRWGMDFAVGKRDAMHYEINYGVTNTQIAQASKKIEKYVGRSGNVIFEKATGPDVKDWQRTLKDLTYPVVIDGVFGPKLTEVTKQFQNDAGITDDGRVGPTTREEAKNMSEMQETLLKEIRGLRDEVSELKATLSTAGSSTSTGGADFLRMSKYGMSYEWWIRMGLILDPNHKNYPADPGSLADMIIKTYEKTTGNKYVPYGG